MWIDTQIHSFWIIKQSWWKNCLKIENNGVGYSSANTVRMFMKQWQYTFRLLTVWHVTGSWSRVV